MWGTRATLHKNECIHPHILITYSILITGDWGKTASRLAKLLSARGIRVQIASRRGENAIPSEYRSQYPSLTGVTFDWKDPSTHINPFTSDSKISAIYLVASVLPALETTKPFIDLAIANGVRRFALLSAVGVDKGGWEYGKVHEYLVDGGLGVDYCILRPPSFYGTCLTHLHRLGLTELFRKPPRHY